MRSLESIAAYPASREEWRQPAKLGRRAAFAVLWARKFRRVSIPSRAIRPAQSQGCALRVENYCTHSTQTWPDSARTRMPVVVHMAISPPPRCIGTEITCCTAGSTEQSVNVEDASFLGRRFPPDREALRKRGSPSRHRRRSLPRPPPPRWLIRLPPSSPSRGGAASASFSRSPGNSGRPFSGGAGKKGLSRQLALPRPGMRAQPGQASRELII